MSEFLADQCTGLFTVNNFQQVAFLVHIEHDDRQLVFFTKCKGRHVHDVQILFIRFLERQFVISTRVPFNTTLACTSIARKLAVESVVK